MSEFQVVYWPTENVCATYDTQAEAHSAIGWYERTYGPMHGRIGIREVSLSAAVPESSE